jgi:sensor histidine kinase regulating citrate/malate metabolism
MSDEIQTIILDSITEGVFTVDKDFRITSFNSAAVPAMFTCAQSGNIVQRSGRPSV